MKIAISATGETNEALLDMRFGRCRYFQIYIKLKEIVQSWTVSFFTRRE